MRSLPPVACLAAIAATLAAGPVAAQTAVSTSTTTPLVTSTAGNVSITTAGTIAVPSGAAVTVDSNNTVDNAGTVSVVKLDGTGANGASGISVNNGVSSTVSNEGTISVTENFNPAIDNDGEIIGATASASNRFGIQTLGAMTGSITNSGTITVDGLNSGGIVLNGPLTGSLMSSGTVSVTGDNSYGIKTGAVDGNVWITNGSVTTIGQGSTALAVTGDVSGSVKIQGAVGQQITYTDNNGTSVTLPQSAIDQGAPAVAISGNVANGVIVAIQPASTSSSSSTTDADNDGIADSLEGTGSVTSYGSGPALLIGGSTPITIGAFNGIANGGLTGAYSLEIDGKVTGNANYSNVNAYGIVIGGQGGTVNMPSGIGIAGTVTAATQSAGATAILINQGATVPLLVNAGTISATIASPGGGKLYGIRDLSGTLTSVENMGTITVGGGISDTRDAIDLSAGTANETISQDISTTNAATRTSNEAGGATDTTVYESITGNILMGSGNDTLKVSDGDITGNTTFGSGTNQLLLSGRADYTGNVDFGTGAATAALSGTATMTGNIDFRGVAGTLTIGDTAVYSGTILNGGASSVTVNGGTFGSNAATTTTIGSLTINSGGALGVYIDGANGLSSRVVATTANLAAGAKVSATISSLQQRDGSYTILSAGTLNSNATFDSTTTALPYIYSGSVTQSGNDLILDIHRKTAAETGLRRAAAQGYEAILAAAGNDSKMQADILGITDGGTLQTQFDQLLPDSAGAVFDTVTRGSRLVAQHVQDADSLYDISSVGGWLEPVYWHASKDTTDTASYSESGWGISTGLEKVTGIGRIGLSYAFLKSKIDDNGGTGMLNVTQHELGLFWRTQKGPLYAFARGSIAHVSVSSTRTFNGTDDGTAFTYTSTGSWHGWLYSGAGGLTYDFPVGESFTLRPKGMLDYYRLQESGYTESGGGVAMDLTVLGRDSSALTATTTLTASYALGRKTRDSRPLTVEVEAGRRNFLSGSLGTTQASFAGGNLFSITPDGQQSAWIGEARLLAGGMDFTWKLAARAEKQADGGVDYSGRASLSVAF